MRGCSCTRTRCAAARPSVPNLTLDPLTPLVPLPRETPGRARTMALSRPIGTTVVVPAAAEQPAIPAAEARLQLAVAGAAPEARQPQQMQNLRALLAAGWLKQRRQS